MTIEQLTSNQISGLLNERDNSVVKKIKELVAGVNDLNVGAPKLKYRFLLSTGPLVLETDTVLVVNTAGGDVDIQLPLSSTVMDDGNLRRFWVHHVGGGNRCRMVFAGSGTFTDGLTFLDVRETKTAQLGAIYDPSEAGWLRITDVPIILSGQVASPMAAGTFIVPTAIPFDTILRQDHSEVLELNLASPTDFVAKKTGDYSVDIHMAFDSTGGGTWNVLAEVQVNGVTVPGMAQPTGNYGGEDDSLSMSQPLQLVAGDVVTIVLSQPSGPLTGNLVNMVITLITEI